MADDDIDYIDDLLDAPFKQQHVSSDNLESLLYIHLVHKFL